MDLETFIFETLTQIVSGVAKAKATIGEMGVGAAVNPVTTHSDKTLGNASSVEFDVAVTVASAAREGEAKEAGAAAGGVLAVVGLKVSGKVEGEQHRENREEAISRVKFEVRLAQPANIERAKPMRIPSTVRVV